MSFLHCHRKFAELTSSILVEKGVNAKNLQQLSQHLPDFLWLIRDAKLKLPKNKETEEPMTPTEYLRQEILSENEKDSHSLLKLFPKLECSMLAPVDVSHSPFFQQMQEIIKDIYRKTKPKLSVSGAAVNGPLMVALIHEYEKAINSGTIFSLEVTWQSAIELHLSKVSDELSEKYTTEMKQHIVGKLPIEEGHLDHDLTNPDTLFGNHRHILADCLDHLDTEMKKLLLPARSQELASPEVREIEKRIRRKFSQRIMTYNKSNTLCGGELYHFVQENKHKSVEKCQKVFESEYNQMTRSNSVSIELLTKEYYKRAIGPAKESVFTEKLEHIPGPPSDVNIQLEGSGSTEMLLSWSEPKIHKDSAKDYEIQMRKGGLPWKDTILWQRKSSSNFTALASNLQPNTGYSFRIRATKDRIYGEFCEPVTLQTNPAPPGAPLKPKVEPISPQEATIIIQGLMPDDGNASVVDKVRLESGFISDTSGRIQKYVAEDIPVEPEHFPLKHKIPVQSYDEKGDYYYQVRFGNRAGYGELSDKTTVKTADLIPSHPTCVTTISSVTSLTFNWKPPNIHPYSVDKYELKVRKRGDEQWMLTHTLLGTSFTVKSLQAMTEYQYEICAKNHHLKGEACTKSVCTEAACPNKPEKPSLQVINSQHVTVSFYKLKQGDENGKPVTHVRIEKSEDREKWESLEFEMNSQKDVIKRKTDLCTRKENKDVVTFLFFRVSMKNEKGWSQPSEEAELRDDDLIPSAPENLQVVVDKSGPREIGLKWQKPTFHAHTVVMYKVSCYSDDEKYSPECELLSHKILQVKPNTTYTIKVKSMNTYNKGEYSEELQHTTPYTPPGHPSDFQVDVISSKEAKLHIQLPELQWGQKPVTHIIVQKSEECSKWENELESVVNCSEGEVMPLTTRYSAYMRIFFKSDVGISKPSKFLSIPASSVIPGRPECFEVTKFTDTSVTLCWKKPGVNAKAAKAYCIQLKKEKEDCWKTLYSVDKMENAITELTPSTTYEFRVCAENDKATGEFCESCEIKTLPKTPGIFGIRIVDHESAELVILKSDFDGGTEIKVETRYPPGIWKICGAFCSTDGTDETTENPLTSCYKVNFSSKPTEWRLQLLNGHYKSEYSDSVLLSNGHFIPGPPTELEASEPGGNSITLTWKDPKENPELVTNYEINVRATDDSYEERKTRKAGKTNEYTVKGLRMATEYFFEVYACNAHGKKGRCACTEMETLCPTPGVPTSLKMAGATSSRIKVRWHAPKETADAVSEYEVYYGISGTSPFKMFTTHKTSAVIKELEPGTSYDFKICSVNKIGDRSEEAECCGLRTKRSKMFKYSIGILTAIPTFGAGAIATHFANKDDEDVYDSP